MYLKLSDFLASRRLPQTGSLVSTRRQNKAGVRREDCGIDRTAMPFKLAHFLACLRFPQTGGLVVTRCENKASVRREDRGIDKTVVSQLGRQHRTWRRRLLCNGGLSHQKQ